MDKAMDEAISSRRMKIRLAEWDDTYETGWNDDGSPWIRYYLKGEVPYGRRLKTSKYLNPSWEAFQATTLAGGIE